MKKKMVKKKEKKLQVWIRIMLKI